MTLRTQAAASAAEFHALHSSPLLLPNAWDVLSARLSEQAGARAIATTSAGMCWAAGLPDGGVMRRDELVPMVARIVAAVAVPVSVDIEGGYGDVAATVESMADLGVAGINLEDSADGVLLPQAEAMANISQARQAAERTGVPLFVNARLDGLLCGDAGGWDAVRVRAEQAWRAGADGIFVPGLADADRIAELASAVPLPVNVMIGAGSPPVSELVAAGARRVSTGMAAAQAAYGVVRAVATEMLSGAGSGGLRSLDGGVDYGELNGLLSA
ncbi:MAG: isocitrate lyase/PEP mutase family protein [Mycetocola sp.]